jgi:hypothetical protein
MWVRMFVLAPLLDVIVLPMLRTSKQSVVRLTLLS